MKFSGLEEEEASRNSSLDPNFEERKDVETQLVSTVSDTRQSTSDEPPTLILKKQCKLKPLLVLGGIELLNTGPDFGFFLPALLTFIVILSTVTYVVMSIQNVDIVIKKAVLYVNLTQNLSYLLAGLLNPGVARTNQRIISTSEELFLCRPCGIHTRPATRHCSYCNACIKGYDHHCPWVGKCIGRGNVVPFFVFVLSTLAAILISMISLMMAIIGS